MKSTTLVVVLLFMVGLAAGEIHNKGWWKNAVFYQIYPRSFMDSDGDGVGDLEGIRSRLSHFKESGITAIWLSPINRSPMVDFGYDISDFRDVDKTFGTLKNLKDLLKEAKSIGLKVVLDLVPNHTSDEHYWFQMSVDGIGKYKDYYIWADAKKDKEGKQIPPNNWLSVFNGSGWTFHEKRKQYYFHQFYARQPDLNYKNEDVRREMQDIIRYWLDIGMDGFRIDAVPHLFEGDITLDEVPIEVPNAKPTDHVSLIHNLTKDRPETYELVKEWRNFVDEYADVKNQDEKVILTEAYTSLDNTLKYYNYGSEVPFNFKFITDANGNSNASRFKYIIDSWIKGTPADGVPNWVMGNHDRTRISTRYPNRADQMTMLAMILPGVAVTYYGEEIGMEDNTAFPAKDFRDGCRTPFQWDNTTNAGFSNATKTWLPVHDNYKTVNLKNEKAASESHYKLYTALINMRKSNVLKHGSLDTRVLNDEVLAVVRNHEEGTVALLINFSTNKTITVDLSSLLGQSGVLKLSNVGSGLQPNTPIKLSAVNIPANVTMILQSNGASVIGYSIVTLVVSLCISQFRF